MVICYATTVNWNIPINQYSQWSDYQLCVEKTLAPYLINYAVPSSPLYLHLQPMSTYPFYFKCTFY